MDQQFTACAGPSIEEVQQRFKQWRAGRKRGAPIPAALWEDAVRLCAAHSLCKISSALRLDYNVLKKRSQPARPDHFPESEASCSQSVTSSDFIALDLRSTLTEFIVEMERAGGRMRIHIKGAPGFHPLAQVHGFSPNFRLPDVGRVFAGNFGNGDGTFFVKMEKIWHDSDRRKN